MSVLENEFRRIRDSLDDALLDLCAHEDFVGLRDTIQRLGEVRRISSQIARHLERNQAVVENFLKIFGFNVGIISQSEDSI